MSETILEGFKRVSDETFKEMVRETQEAELGLYLLSHESDIALGVNDFGNLYYVFKYYVGSTPKK